MNKKIKLILIIIAVVLLIIFFFPKSYVKGGLGGFIGPGATAYKEEYSCFGLKYSYNSPFFQCADCGVSYYCSGILYGKKCYMEQYSGGGTISKEVTDCR